MRRPAHLFNFSYNSNRAIIGFEFMTHIKASMLPLIEQDPTSLSFGFLSDSIQLHLNVLQAQVVHCGAWRFVFQIVGESHRVLIYQEDILVHQEVLACIPLVAQDCQHYAQFASLQDYQLQAQPYQFDIRFSTENVPLFSQVDMEVDFPQLHGVTPVTQLRWNDTGKSMRWWTLHLYPRSTDTVTVLTYSEYTYSR